MLNVYLYTSWYTQSTYNESKLILIHGNLLLKVNLLLASANHLEFNHHSLSCLNVRTHGSRLRDRIQILYITAQCMLELYNF